MGTIKNSSNPQAMLNLMANSNPQLKQVLTYIKDNGGNAQQAFYNYAQQNGVDPNEVLDALK